MKLKSITLLVAGALLVNLSDVAAQETFQDKFEAHRAQVGSISGKGLASVVSRPGKGQVYQPDGGSGWLYVANSAYSYDNLGRFIERTEHHPVTNAPIYKIWRAYNSQGHIIEDYHYDGQNNNWVMQHGNSVKFAFIYNSSNQFTESITEQWDDISATFENSFKSTRVYNSQGQLEQETHYGWAGSIWEPFSRSSYVYNSTGNQPAEMIYQDYENGGWVNFTRYTDISWHHFDISDPLFLRLQPLNYNGHEWNGSAWELTQRGSVTYDQFGSSAETVETIDNGIWENLARMTITFDYQSNYTGTKREMWSGSAWAAVREDVQLHTYNANFDIIETVYQHAMYSNPMQNDYKETFSDFQYFTTAVPAAAELQVSIYPNPAANQLFISGEQPGNLIINITDLAGRTVAIQQLPAGNREVNIGHLTPGTYLLHLSSTTGSKTIKVVKL